MPETQPYVCPDCGRSFSLERGLTRHRNYAHPGGQPAAPAKPKVTSATIGEALGATPSEWESVTAPLRAEAQRLRGEYDALTAEREQVASQMRRLEAAVRALDRTEAPKKPGPQANPGPKKKRAHASEETVSQVLGYIQSHPEELAEGFTSSDLARKIASNGDLGLSKDRIRVAVNTLHDQGQLRLVRKTQGGGKLYKLTAAGGGGQDG